MYKSLLTKKFFKDNPIKDISSQRFFSSLISYKGIEDYANEFVLKNVDLGAERLDRIRNEKEIIENEQDPDELINFLRKNFELVNRMSLINRVLEFESELMPKVIEKLIRSDHDILIENAIRLLAKSEENYSQRLYIKYNQIRSPYVQSMVCLILGFRGNEEIIPWMMNQYTEMKRLYPDETYDQGPLLALHKLHHRFYEKNNRVLKKGDILAYEKNNRVANKKDSLAERTRQDEPKKETDQERQTRIYPIILSEYNPAWVDWFSEEKANLERLIGMVDIVRICHFGSTSVPGLSAKPTVDILLEIKEGTNIDHLIASLSSPDYVCLNPPDMPTKPPHLMFLKGYLPDGFAEKVYHIHVRYRGDPDELYFRDYLIDHPDIAASYSELKHRLFKDYEHDRDGYTQAKTDFVRSITEKAKGRM